ncbi:SRPBCC domain-containing protein [Nocardioides seonyuensis]|uniref:SRPBCC domain-containing protein n=1 Tax=Nocardioides seonyuensis TaxID=2518371 RepID=A0A4V1BME4_9ACTN|nr:SRPBCC domain-containing protein [Nocardioides seonyuensis]QBX56082.1 SRPBCC domain-containing protein [Nocardioides seonyuensis]
MKQITRTLDIPATPEAVWSVLADTDSYERWNPFVTKLSGRLAVGERLEVRIQPPGGRAMTFRPRVVTVEPGRALRWLGRLGVPGVFDGLHELRLEPTAAGTRFVHSETFRGLLVPLLGKTLAATADGFDAMNQALAEECARRSSGEHPGDTAQS